MAVGKIVANVIANTGPFQKGLKTAGKDAKAFAGSVGKGVGALAKLAAGASLAGGALVTGLVVQGLMAVDAQAKLARSVDGTQRGLVGLIRAANDAGVSQADAAKSAQVLGRSLGDAMQKGGAAEAALDRLGLKAEDLAAMDVDERFAALSDAMNDAGMTAAQMAGTLGELGVRNKEMIVLMQGGGDTIRAATVEMERYGVAVTDIEAAEVEALNDAMDRGKEVMKGVANQLAVRLAPLIQGVVVLLGEASGETGGFGDIMDRVISASIQGIGWLADRLAAFRLGLLGIAAVGELVDATILRAMASMGQSIEMTLGDIVEEVNGMIRTANRLPGIELPEIDVGESKFVKTLVQMADTAEAELGASKARLEELANEPLPSESLDRWVEDVKAKSREAAEAAVEARKDQTTRELQTLEDGQSRAELSAAASRARETEARRKTAQEGLESLQAFLMTEVETENAAHQAKLAQLEASAAELGLLEEEQRTIREGLEQAHVDRLNSIRQNGLTEAERFSRQSWQNQTAQVTGELNSLLQGVKSNSKAIFNIQKVGAIANAIVSTYQGAALALANYPGPLGWAMAAATVAAGLANVAAIKGQTFGGGGGGGGAPSSGAQAAASAAGGPGGSGGNGSQDTLTVSPIDPSALFSGGMVSALAESLTEYQRNGGQVVLT